MADTEADAAGGSTSTTGAGAGAGGAGEGQGGGTGGDSGEGGTTRTAGEAQLAEAASDESLPEDWSPPRHRADGVAVDPEGLPINLRLRSLELARRGDTEDPAGLASPDLIADAKGRIDAYEEAYPPLGGKKTAELEAIAEREKVSLEGATTNPERAARIAAARPALV
jgi:hypothetical protein